MSNYQKIIQSCLVIALLFSISNVSNSVATTPVYAAENVCNSQTQPSPNWGVKNNQCLPSCGSIGGTTASVSQTCSEIGKTDVGEAYDANYCCTNIVENTAPYFTAPAPTSITLGEKYKYTPIVFDNEGDNYMFALGSSNPYDKISLRAIDGYFTFKPKITGIYSFTIFVFDPSNPHLVNYQNLSIIVNAPEYFCNPETQPSPHWGVKGNQCLPSCGLIGGTTASVSKTCSEIGKTDVGQAYDANSCCK